MDRNERILRGVFMVFDLVPGIGYLNDVAKSGGKVAVKNVVKNSLKEGFEQGTRNLDTAVKFLSHFGDNVLKQMDNLFKQGDQTIGQIAKKFSLNAGGDVRMGGRSFSKTSLGRLADNVEIVDSVPAEVVNDWWKEVMDYSNPPYLPGSEVETLTVTKKTKFVRVYDGDVSGQYGGWLMAPEDIKGLSPEQIRDLYALPATPKYITDVIIEPGTKIRTGIVNPLDGWGAGGARQYDLLGQRTGQFVNERPLL